MFSVHRQSGAFVNTSTKLCHANGCGQIRDDNACSFVISAVRAMKTNGARNAIPAAMRTLWFATAISIRLRRTRAGGRRRASGAVIPTALIVLRSAPSGAS